MELDTNEKKRVAKQIKRLIHEGAIQIGLKTRQDFVRTAQEMADAHNDALHRIAVLERALEKACEVIKEIMPKKPMYICGEAIAERLGIPMTSEIKDYDYFIHQAEKELEGEE